MPRLLKAKKDVTSCDKPGGGANIHYIPGFPNGATHYVEDIVFRSNAGSKRAELKHLSRRRRRKQK
jgi:hypothetical protein